LRTAIASFPTSIVDAHVQVQRLIRQLVPRVIDEDQAVPKGQQPLGARPAAPLASASDDRERA
jgi:hypothetical protein